MNMSLAFKQLLLYALLRVLIFVLNVFDGLTSKTKPVVICLWIYVYYNFSLQQRQFIRFQRHREQ